MANLTPRTKSMEYSPQVSVVVGAQWGDEGKGKIVDTLSAHYDFCCRYNGGSNAGHTLWVEGKRYAFHLLPSGVLHPNNTGVIGNGVVLHLPTLFKEITELKSNGIALDTNPPRLLVSDRAHLVFDIHMLVDGLQEGARAVSGNKIGTTKKGIGPCYADKASRVGIRVCDLMDFDEIFTPRFKSLVEGYKSRFPGLEYDVEAELKRYRELSKQLQPYVVDTVHYLSEALKAGKRILIEGANAAMLDVDFGTYPYVTSSHPSTGGIPCGLGIPPAKFGWIIGVVKAYTTRVGEGPFPTELPITDPVGKHLQQVGHEVGTTTGRPRRCGWLDLVLLKFTATINGYTHVDFTKLDVLTGLNPLRVGVAYHYKGQRLENFPASAETLEKVTVEYEEMPGWSEDISKCRSFSELPENAQKYILRVQETIGCPVSWIGVGHDREDTIEIPP